jgi:D-alanyl-D-alanine carboxypeptidase (penicillin-binding protein 5/6)
MRVLAWFGALLVGYLFVAATVAAPAATPAGEIATKAGQAILMDAASGAILYRKNADDRVPPASMTKLMTLALLFKAVNAGTVKLDEEVVMSVDAWRRGGAPSGTSAMFVPVNTKVRIDELIQGLIVQSGNDAAIAVAERLGGSEPKFAQLMTEEGKRIGLTASNFTNATGLHHPEHLSTARDLATLAKHLIDQYPNFYPMFGQREFIYRKHKFFNRNPLLTLSIGVDGLKTGQVKESGYGLVASAVQDGRRLILVVHGCDTAQERREEAQRLLEWGFKSFAEARLYDPGEVVGEARVYGGTRLYVPLVGADGVKVLLPRTPANPRLKAEIVYRRPLLAPIKKGDEVARLRVTGATSAVNDVPLYAAEDVEVGPIWRRGLDSLAHLALGWVR